MYRKTISQLYIELGEGVGHVPLFQNNAGTGMQLTGQNLHNEHA